MRAGRIVCASARGDKTMSSQQIKVQLPDGSVREVASGSTAYEVAMTIGQRLADASLAAEMRPINNGADPKLIDMSRPLTEDVKLRLLTEKDPEALEVFHHSSAHLMATAVIELFPETKLGHGPPTENGFFYDFYRPTPFTPDDLVAIEKRMQQIVERDEKFVLEHGDRADAIARYKAEGDWMKVHFIEKHTESNEVTFYRNGKFVDFCRGPHIPSTGRIKAFKLLSIAGAYWLGDEKNPQLQRIYGTSFYNKKLLDEYMNKLEEAKRRDHRVLGK